MKGMDEIFDSLAQCNRTLLSQASAAAYFGAGLNAYNDTFLKPLLAATEIFTTVEMRRLLQRTPQENFEAYLKLLAFNIGLFNRYGQGVMDTLGTYSSVELDRFFTAMNHVLFNGDKGKLAEYLLRHESTLRWVVEEYPRAILDIEPEYGFHFENTPNSVVAETDRYLLHRVPPTESGVETDHSLKPVIIIPPFVLGANILAFLPGERKSYAHSFANRSVPTYIRIMKEIHSTPAVQTMTLEDNARDTRYFCEEVMKKHGRKITLNGYCQGGYSSLCNILSGELDGLVDAFITCVAPMDGTRSQGLGEFLRNLPQAFNDLAYGTKTLENGNTIADGNLMGWIYKLKSIENSGPMVAFLHDIMMTKINGGLPKNTNKTVAAIQYWLANERSDLPLAVTEMSFRSYNIPITEDGTLPTTMFGKKLNLHAIKEKNIPWLLCYGQQDDLVEKEVALAPLDFIDVEVTPFPKGHVAIATSWSHPDSDCALDTVFGKNKYRGPVRFHLDLAKQQQ